MTAPDAAASTTSTTADGKISDDQASTDELMDLEASGADSVATAPGPQATATPLELLAKALPEGVLPFGRIPVVNVQPLVDGGARPAKSVEHEEFVVAAQVFREGHDAVSATVVLTDPEGTDHHFPMSVDNAGLNWWSARVSADRPGWWTYRVEGWSDPWATWLHDATIKVEAGIDAELMLQEGALLLERTRDDRHPSGACPVDDAVTALRDTTSSPVSRLRTATSPLMQEWFKAHPHREMVSPTPAYRLLVERELALFGAWYEIFPRSEGAWYDDQSGQWHGGTLRTAAERLRAIAGMGFDVVYLTPVSPIGTTARKGRNNALDAVDGDPGSPYAIGSPDGGHDAIHRDLGTFDDFDVFVHAARRNGLEVAIDIALQASPDHPYVETHPEWFTTRADGTIAYAENPPKKYQDIYPLNFDNDPAGSYAEMRRVIQVWIDHGVTLFRVDNPHTKPIQFWQWLIADVGKDHPEIIWLAEAFTKPAMMHSLGKAGFQQSYTYYAWRNMRWELEAYLRELAGEASAYMRPSFWPTTHDILTPYMQYGGPTAWTLRAALAATLVPTYGIYAGYELMENVARQGAEEQVDNEKYQYKDRHWEHYEPGGPKEGQNLTAYLTKLNAIRRAHPALRWLRNIAFHTAQDENILVFSKTRVVDGRRDTILVVANLDPHATRSSVVDLDMPALGLGWDDTFRARDLITEQTWIWRQQAFVRLGPETHPVHIIEVRSI
ncbi:MAG: maltotransferase domain-containing protein [Lapillicoccus sp.]